MSGFWYRYQRWIIGILVVLIIVPIPFFISNIIRERNYRLDYESETHNLTFYLPRDWIINDTPEALFALDEDQNILVTVTLFDTENITHYQEVYGGVPSAEGVIRAYQDGLNQQDVMLNPFIMNFPGTQVGSVFAFEDGARATLTTDEGTRGEIIALPISKPDGEQIYALTVGLTPLDYEDYAEQVQEIAQSVVYGTEE